MGLLATLNASLLQAEHGAAAPALTLRVKHPAAVPNPALAHRASRAVFTFTIAVAAAPLFGQLTPICEIQGSGSASPLANQQVTTRGIITAAYQGPGSIGGYFLQDPACDADPLTSDGVYVYDPSGSPVTVGDEVEVTATVSEYNGLTELGTITGFTVLSSGNSVSATEVLLPVASADFLERHEGMLVGFPQTLVATDNYNWARYGELVLSSGDRLSIPTDTVDPNDDPPSGTTSTGNSNVAAVSGLMALNQRNRFILDDGLSMSYPFPPPYQDPTGTLRSGSTVDGLQGVMSYGFGAYRLFPTNTPTWSYAARPAVPEPAGTLRVVSFNVLNYWTTLGGWGAQTATELERQRTKLVAAISAMDPDVLGLMEMENNGSAAYQDLLDAVNAAVGAGTYAALDASMPGYYETKSVIFYKPEVVSLAGPLDALNDTIIERPILTQAFTDIGTGASFLFCLDHLRFKGCAGAVGADLDQGDGQACFNATRRAQAELVVARLTDLIAQSGIDRVIIAGDFNAYSQEDPIDVIAGAGYVSLVAEGEHSYGYQAEWGALDHAFTTPNMQAAVVATRVWNCNSDEPRALDWADADTAFYQPDAYRSSDHDPVVIDVNAGAIPTAISEPLITAGVRLFPVPCADVLNIICDQDGVTRMRVELLDLFGRVVATGTDHVRTAGGGGMRLPVGQLATGAYGYRLLIARGAELQRYQGTVMIAR